MQDAIYVFGTETNISSTALFVCKLPPSLCAQWGYMLKLLWCDSNNNAALFHTARARTPANPKYTNNVESRRPKHAKQKTHVCLSVVRSVERKSECSGKKAHIRVRAAGDDAAGCAIP